MKKILFIMSMAFAGMQNAVAQTSEIFASYSSVNATASRMLGDVKLSESDSYSALSLGYNSLRPCLNDNFYFVIGGKFSYIWDKGDNYTENIYRIKVPVSLK